MDNCSYMSYTQKSSTFRFRRSRADAQAQPYPCKMHRDSRDNRDTSRKPAWLRGFVSENMPLAPGHRRDTPGHFFAGRCTTSHGFGEAAAFGRDFALLCRPASADFSPNPPTRGTP